MSFDLFVSPLSSRDDSQRRRIMGIIWRDIAATDDLCSVRYADGSGALEVCGLDRWSEPGSYKTGLCFRRFGGSTFMARLFELADSLDAMVFWPGEPPFVAVTRQDLFELLPPELDPSNATIVTDADHLLRCITA